VLKKSAPFWSFWGLNNVVASVLTATSYEVAGTGDIGGRLRNRTSRLIVLGSRRQEELFSYELQPAQPEPIETDVIMTL
jgi:hypothetical protein